MQLPVSFLVMIVTVEKQVKNSSTNQKLGFFIGIPFASNMASLEMLMLVVVVSWKDPCFQIL